MQKWKTVPEELPVDQSIVWVRINYWFGQPFLAKWDLASQSFISEDTDLIYPVWSVMRWKYQFTYEYINLGNQTVFSSTSMNSGITAIPVTFFENGTIMSISMYHEAGSGLGLMGIYSNGVDSKPTDLLASSAETALSGSAGWQTFDLISPLEVTAGTIVWMAFVLETNPGTKYQAGTPGRAYGTTAWPDRLIDPFGTSNLANYTYSVYLTYRKTVY